MKQLINFFKRKKILYKLLNFSLFRFLFKKINIKVLNYKKNFGYFFIILPRHLNYFFNNSYEEETFQFIKKKLNKHDLKNFFIDIGANVGVYSLYFRQNFNSKIIAYEPDEKNYKLIKSTINKNKFKNFYLKKICLSNKNSSEKFLIDDIRGMTGSLSNKRNTIQIHQRLKNYKFVKTCKFDDIFKLKDKISLIKIDVENHELEVIDGMIKNIKKFKPLLIIESNTQNIKSLKMRLNKLNYKCKHIKKNSNYVFYH